MNDMSHPLPLSLQKEKSLYTSSPEQQQKLRSMLKSKKGQYGVHGITNQKKIKDLEIYIQKQTEVKESVNPTKHVDFLINGWAELNK